MSSIQRATIVALIIATLGVWGLGLRAAMRAGARTGQDPISTPTETLTAAISAISGTPTPLLGTSPTTATPVATSIHSPTATPTSRPSASASPSATATWQPIPTLPPELVGTPTIPRTGRFLLVNQDEQMMHVYENGNEIRSIPISSGRPVANAFTPAWRGDVGRYWGSGPFLNTSLWSDHMWYLFPGARGSILIHSVPYTWQGDLKIYDRPDALGVEPSSHGCVRVSPEDAQWLETWDPVGVPIEITPWSGEIGPPDESL